MVHEGLRTLVAKLATGAAAAASRSSREAAAASATQLSRIASASREQARRVAEEPGALPALVAALAAGSGLQDGTAATCAKVLSWMALVGLDVAASVAEVPGALPALVETMAGGGEAAQDCILTLPNPHGHWGHTNRPALKRPRQVRVCDDIKPQQPAMRAPPARPRRGMGQVVHRQPQLPSPKSRREHGGRRGKTQTPEVAECMSNYTSGGDMISSHACRQVLLQ